MEIRLIPAGSEAYRQMLELRIKALLEPIGIPASYLDPEKEKNDLFIAAFENEQMVGCCVLTRHTREEVQLRQMAVHPHWQGKQLGRSILGFAEDVARQHHFKTIMMHARNPVIGFYEKCGYRIVGNEFFEVGMGHHNMYRNLG